MAPEVAHCRSPRHPGNIDGTLSVVYRYIVMRKFVPLLVAGLLAGCGTTVHESSIEQVQAGMTRDEVQAKLGAPESATFAPGQDCGYYTVIKSFWRRTPWSMTERYSVCYIDGRVDRRLAYGRRHPCQAAHLDRG